MIIGHNSIISFFEEVFKNQRWHHAYTFVGPNQVGKRTVAYYVGAKLLATTPAKLNQQPDFFYLERMTDEKTGKRKKDITVEQARRFKARFETTSWSGGYHVIVFNEAEFLNEEAGNALLKIIEEPPVKTIIFLLTTDDTKLLPTIRSRTQVVTFSTVPDDIIQDALEKLSCPTDKARELARISWGRPGRALQFFENDEWCKQYTYKVERFKKLLLQPFYIQLQLVEDMFDKDEKDDHIKVREDLICVLEIWEMEWRAMLVGNNDGVVYKNYSIEKIIEIIDKIEEGKKFLRQNIHPRLIIEHILLAF
jgi:DNA polymerase-3 subunit delta'